MHEPRRAVKTVFKGEGLAGSTPFPEMLEICNVNVTILRTTVQNCFCFFRSQIISTSTF